MSYNETQVSEIVAEAIALRKKVDASDKRFPNKEREEYYDGYSMNVDAMREIAIHAVRGAYPERLIESRAPNMTEQEKNYIAANYKQRTLPVYVDFINTIKRAFADNNWAIEFGDESVDENSFRYYCEVGISKTKTKMPLNSYMQNVVPNIKILDASGCIAMKPEAIKVEQVDGAAVMSSELLDPIPQYYSCEQLHWFIEGEAYLFLTNEYSEVTTANGNKKERTGFIYEFYDRNQIYRIIQVGAKKDNQFTVEPYYTHDENWCPVKRLEGSPEPFKGSISWISPFSYAVPVLDDAIIDANQLRAVKAKCAFPYRVMLGNTCEEKMTLSNGEISCCDGLGFHKDMEKGIDIICKGCNGSGVKNRVTPLGEMLLKPKTPMADSELTGTHSAMSYVSPDTAILQFVSDQVQMHMAEARKILHIRESSTEVKGSEDMTATGMVIDEKALYAFISPISQQLFNIFGFILDWIGIIRYGQKQKYVLTPPKTFDFKTEYDYLMEISMAIKNGLPPVAVHAIVLMYLKTLFYGDTQTSATFNLIIKADRLLTMDDDELVINLSKGLVAPYEVILHQSAASFVATLLSQNPKYFSQTEGLQMQQLIDMAKAKAAETKSADPLNPLSIVQSVLNGTAA